VSADTIYLKNGRKIAASHVVRENGQVSYETSAGRMSLPVSIVDKVVHEDESLESTAGTAADKAAHLPIAAPNALARSADQETARAAVRDGSIDLKLLAKLESEADANPTLTAVAHVVAAESAAAQFGISVGDFEQAAMHLMTSDCCSQPRTFTSAEVSIRRRSICSTTPGASTPIPRTSPSCLAGPTTG
jgi:hypothetical protein